MLPSLVTYAGLLTALIGALTLVRPLRALGVPTRRRALAVVALGIAVAAVGAFLPAPPLHVRRPLSRLDAIVPTWQFGERHETRVHAGLAEVEAAVRAVTAREIRLFRLLTWIRNPRRSWNGKPPTILAPPADRPLLDVALSSGFLLLAEQPRSELVFGTLVVVPPELARLPAAQRARLRAELSPQRFRGLQEPGYAKAVMSFRLVDAGGGWTRLTTETRVFCTDDVARHRFAPYWRLIYPGSALIRRTWLAAIRDRAERSARIAAGHGAAAGP